MLMNRDFTLFLCARFCSSIAAQMINMAVAGRCTTSPAACSGSPERFNCRRRSPPFPPSCRRRYAMRAAPGLGAGATALWLAFRPVSRHVGNTMFVGVAAFGIATVVLGLTHHFRVALIALVILGVGDMISVFVRALLVQLNTPDEIRGRVSAVNAPSSNRGKFA